MHKSMAFELDFEQILLTLNDVVLLIDEGLVFRKYWTRDLSMLWRPPQEFLRKTLAETVLEPLRTVATEAIVKALEQDTSEKFVYNMPFGEETRWFRVRICPLKEQMPDGKRLILLLISDCTKEILVKNRNRVFETLIDQNWEAIRFIDMDLTIRYVNPALERLYGYSKGELIGRKVSLFTKESQYTTEKIKKIVLTEGSWSGDLWQVRKDNTRFEAFVSIQMIYDDQGKPMGLITQSKDISERKETATKLKNTIKERETLLKEIHHRVKNNLQVITSLLSLQASTLKDLHIRDVFQQSQYRINAMATIHETLYQSDDFCNISYDQYIHTLASYLLLSMKGQQHNISLDIDAVNIVLSIDEAVPLGLLINEIMTNALKYGLKDQKEGHLYIHLKMAGARRYQLLIGDNGVGYSSDVTFKNTQSLGLKLIYGLTRQLDGTIERDFNRKGTHYCIEFGGPHASKG